VDTHGWYVCNSCQPGFFWMDGNATDQGNCVLCEEKISGCFRCENENFCNQCLEGFYPSLDKKSCIPPIEHCITDPSNYRQTPGAPRCVTCQKGFYPNKDKCELCSSIDTECLTCKDNGVCTSCKDGFNVTAKGSACMKPFENCLSNPINYALDHEGEYYCPKCDDGYTWWHGECTECLEAIPGCKVCDFHGTCRRCEEGTFLSHDRTQCKVQFENCRDKTPAQYVLKSSSDFSFEEWACSSCGKGFYFDQKSWNCLGLCGDYGLDVVDCDEYRILECREGYMVTPDGLSC